MKTLLAVLFVLTASVCAFAQTPVYPSRYTVATLPAASSLTNKVVEVTDSATGGCGTGGGSIRIWCHSDGASWSSVGDGAGTGTSPVTNVTATVPVRSSGGATPNITIDDAKADGSTKGASDFLATDFNDDGAGKISLDYPNGQKATDSVPGFLTAADHSAFNLKLGSSLLNGKIFVGNGSDVATPVTPSGDMTITNTGVTAIGAGKVVSSMLNITTSTCTNQFLTAISATGIGTCTTDVLVSAQHANQGTVTTLLHGNAAGNPSFGQIVNADITNGTIDLTAKVAGVLPSANGGTGVNNAGTITNPSNTSITGGGTFVLGGFTFTVPATGTAALLGAANIFTAANSFLSTVGVGDATHRGVLTVTGVDTSNPPTLQLSNPAGRAWNLYVGFSPLNANTFSIYDATANAHRLTIDSSGMVGIGDSTHRGVVAINGVDTSSPPTLQLNNAAGRAWNVYVGPTGLNANTFSIYDVTASAHRFLIDSSGTATLAGDVQLSASTANLFMKDSSTGFQVSSTTVINPQANNSIRSTSFTSGLLGWNINALGNAEFANVDVRGAIHAAIFTYNAINVTAGTQLVVPSGAKLKSDVVVTASPTYGTTTFTIDAVDQEGISHAASQLFAVNDILRLKDGLVGDTWFKVTAVSDQTTFWRYTASIQAGSNNVTYRAGQGIPDYGVSGKGGIMLTADQTNSPYLQMFTHGATFSSADASGTLNLTPQMRCGNLNGSYGYASDIFGCGFGQSTGAWLKIDPTNGVRIGFNTTTYTQIDASGNASFTGTVTAGAGAIGGFNIGPDYIRDAANSFGLSSTVTGGDDIRFWAGDTFANRGIAPFRLTESGYVRIITADIGPWTLNANSIVKDTGVDATSAGMAPADYPFFAGATYTDRATAPFRVTPAGALFANNATVSGTVTGGGGNAVLDSNGFSVVSGTGTSNKLVWKTSGVQTFELYDFRSSTATSAIINASTDNSAGFTDLKISATGDTGPGRAATFYLRQAGSTATDADESRAALYGSVFDGFVVGGSGAPNAMLDVRGDIFSTGSLGATGSRLVKGWFIDLQVTNSIVASITGNAATATALQNARTIAGVSFDGTANISIASTNLSNTSNIPLLTTGGIFTADIGVAYAANGSSVGSYFKNTGTGAGTLSRFSVGQTNAESVALLVQFDHAAGTATILNRKSSTGTLELQTTGGGITVQNSGGVVIGSPTGGDKGSGSINAVTVWRNGTSLDSVFEPEYNLMTIDAMGDYVKLNHHLPTIPTGEVNVKGSTNLGALTDRLWETTENHALYIMQLNDRIKALAAMVTDLQKREN